MLDGNHKKHAVGRSAILILLHGFHKVPSRTAGNEQNSKNKVPCGLHVEILSQFGLLMDTTDNHHKVTPSESMHYLK